MTATTTYQLRVIHSVIDVCEVMRMEKTEVEKLQQRVRTRNYVLIFLTGLVIGLLMA